MNNIIKFTLSAAVAAMTLAACEKDPELKVTDKGPDMTCKAAEAVQMGGSLPFEVTLNDKVALSTLKAYLSFDGTVVASKTIRTKANGVYKDTLHVPFYANIAGGQADIKFVSQNIEFGLTEYNTKVNVTRPEFDYWTLVDTDGNEYKMTKTGNDNEFSYSGNFATKANMKLVSPVFGPYKDQITIGYDGSNVVENGESYLPFDVYTIATEYKLTFNSYSLSYTSEAIGDTTPTITLKFEDFTAMDAKYEIPAGSYGKIYQIAQGATLKIDNFAQFADWSIDPDYLALKDASKGEFTFLPVSGFYRIVLQTGQKYVRIQQMINDSDLTASSNYPVLNDDFSGVLWAIGDATVGKPVASGASWNPEVGGLPCAQLEPMKFQLTLVAGTNIGTVIGSNFKFFFQRSWGGELGGKSYSSVELPSELAMSEDGNIGAAKTLTAGTVYKFTVDFTNAVKSGSTATGVKLVCESK